MGSIEYTKGLPKSAIVLLLNNFESLVDKAYLVHLVDKVESLESPGFQ